MRTALMAGFSAALCAFACTGAVAAPDPARLAEARDLLRAMQMERQIDSLSTMLGDGMAKQMAQSMPKMDPRVAQISMSEAMTAFRELATRPGGLLDSMAQSYAAEFSLDELRQIRAFHESPVGQHMLRSNPALAQRMMEQSMAATRDLYPRLCPRIKARLAAEKVSDGNMKCPAP